MFAVLFFFLSQLLIEPYSLLRCSLDFSCVYFISLFIIIISSSLLCHPTWLSSLFPSSLHAVARDAGMPQGCHSSSLGIFHLEFILLSKSPRFLENSHFHIP